MALLLSPDCFLIFFKDPDQVFSINKLAQVLKDSEVSITSSGDQFMVDSKYGVAMTAGLHRGEEVQTLLQR